MKIAGTLLLHGYGVRGTIWAAVRASLGDRAGHTLAPDLSGSNVDELVTIAKGRARRFALEEDGPVVVVGHSLGAVLAGIVARDVGPPTVAGAVLIAPPFGERRSVPGPLLRFLLWHRLIPPALLRPRFFSSRTPESVQRSVFAAAAREAPDLRKLAYERTWFHTDMFTMPLPIPTLVIASATDRIVPVDQSLTFARAIGAQTHVFGIEDGVGHNDFLVAPGVVERTASLIAGFVAGL